MRRPCVAKQVMQKRNVCRTRGRAEGSTKGLSGGGSCLKFQAVQPAKIEREHSIRSYRFSSRVFIAFDRSFGRTPWEEESRWTLTHTALWNHRGSLSYTFCDSETVFDVTDCMRSRAHRFAGDTAYESLIVPMYSTSAKSIFAWVNYTSGTVLFGQSSRVMVLIRDQFYSYRLVDRSACFQLECFVSACSLLYLLDIHLFPTYLFARQY